MTFTFKLSRRLALIFATVTGGALVGCSVDEPAAIPFVPALPSAIGDTLFSDGFESGALAWDDNYLPQAKTIVAGAARTGSRGLRVSYAPGADGGALSKFVARGDRVYLRAAVRFPTTWTGETRLLLLRAAPAATPWSSFGIAGQCPTGATWAVTNAATTSPNLDLRFYSYFVGMTRQANGQCLGLHGLPGDGGTATYTAPLAVSKGVWHIVELEAQLNAVGQANGWQKLWLDGALKGEWSGLMFRTSSLIQWNAVTLELSAGTISQAQSLDIDDVLVLPERPAPLPPPPAAAETLYVNGFESGSLNGWDDNYNPGAHAVIAAAAATGSRGLRATYQPGSDAGALSKFVARRNRIYARASVRFPANWTGDTKVLLFRAAPSTTPWASFGVAGQCPTGANWAITNAATTVPNLDPRFYSYFVGMRTESNGQCWGRYGVTGDGGVATYTAPLSVSKGGWHVVELEAEMNAVGQANGWQKLWLDGVLKGEWNGLAFRTTSALQWNAVTLELSSGTITQTQSLDIDDVVVLASRPGSGAPTPPPPPPSPAPPAPVATVSIVPASPSISVGGSVQLQVTLRDAAGHVVSGRPVSWSTSNAAIAAISGTGNVTGVALGTATVTATSEGKSGTATITVTAPSPTPPPSGSGEPAFNAATNVSMFYDDFESYANTQSLVDGSGRYRYVLNYNGLKGTSLITGAAGEGSKKVSFDFQAAGTYDRLLESFSVGSDAGDVVNVSWLYRNVGTIWYVKQFIVNKDQSRRFTYAAHGVMAPQSLALCFYDGGMYGTPKTPDIPPSHSSSPYFSSDPTGYQYTQNRGWLQFKMNQTINDGRWHRYTTRFTRETAGPGTGRVEMWIDGIKIMEYLGDDASRCEYGKVFTATRAQTMVRGIQFPTTSSGAVAWTGGATIEYDAIRIWR